MNPLQAGQAPSHIGGYALVGRLGAGGMGQVYLARSARGELVAVKVIREEIVGHPEALPRFRREVATVRTIRDARTARLVDASLDEPPYWLATEYVPGPRSVRRSARKAPSRRYGSGHWARSWPAPWRASTRTASPIGT
ncbi:hypothetical protein [Streptomyces sp. NPDC093071]|uniref:protein kinase domain-containing protein n=1 Tax=Streptomyces sp. NPDC093071 TaxID=3366022 RepID=UPI003800BE3C